MARRDVRAKTGCEGQGLVEYALIIVLVILAAVAAVSLFGRSVGGLFSVVSGAF